MPNAAPRPVNLAVINRRSEPADSLDYFPTPPWATRALFECVLFKSTFGVGIGAHCTVREPACGEGHMAVALAEYFGTVHASDVHDYGFGSIADFTTADANLSETDWIITNPPFNRGLAFLTQAFAHARCGVALLLRSVWRHGQRRHDLFELTPPALIADFAERVPMVKGRWDPEASSATDYSWFIWSRDQRSMIWRRPGAPNVWGAASYEGVWIPPGQRQRLTRPTDYERFGARRAAPLLEHA